MPAYLYIHLAKGMDGLGRYEYAQAYKNQPSRLQDVVRGALTLKLCPESHSAVLSLLYKPMISGCVSCFVKDGDGISIPLSHRSLPV